LISHNGHVGLNDVDAGMAHSFRSRWKRAACHRATPDSTAAVRKRRMKFSTILRRLRDDCSKWPRAGLRIATGSMPHRMVHDRKDDSNSPLNPVTTTAEDWGVNPTHRPLSRRTVRSGRLSTSQRGLVRRLLPLHVLPSHLGGRQEDPTPITHITPERRAPWKWWRSASGRVGSIEARANSRGVCGGTLTSGMCVAPPKWGGNYGKTEGDETEAHETRFDQHRHGQAVRPSRGQGQVQGIGWCESLVSEGSSAKGQEEGSERSRRSRR